MHKLHEIILTFFYCGKAKKAPGTVGSFASMVLWLLISLWFFSHEITFFWQNIFWAVFLVLAFFYGVFATPIYAKKFGQIDHQTIVLDEVVGQILALHLTFLAIGQNYFLRTDLVAIHLFFCFASFRFFDITKPSFIGYCDRNFKNGFGVMFDDLLCGIVTAILGVFFLKLTLMIG